MSALDRRPDLAHRDDRPDREVRVARREEDRVGLGDRVHDARCGGRFLGSLVHDRVDLVTVAAADEPLLERERPGRRDDVCPEAIVGRRDDPCRQPGAGREAGGDLREGRTRPKRARPDEVETEVAVADAEPVLSAPVRCGFERGPALVGPPPAALRVDQIAERVEQAVEVWRDVEAEDLDVVADVADHGQLARLEDLLQATREAGAAAATREQDDPHTGTARSARVRGPSLTPRGSRSASESTSASSSGMVTVAKGACARKRSALPGP